MISDFVLKFKLKTNMDDVPGGKERRGKRLNIINSTYQGPGFASFVFLVQHFCEFHCRFIYKLRLNFIFWYGYHYIKPVLLACLHRQTKKKGNINVMIPQCSTIAADNDFLTCSCGVKICVCIIQIARSNSQTRGAIINGCFNYKVQQMRKRYWKSLLINDSIRCKTITLDQMVHCDSIQNCMQLCRCFLC